MSVIRFIRLGATHSLCMGLSLAALSCAPEGSEPATTGTTAARPAANESAAPHEGHGYEDIHSHIFGIEGTVVSVEGGENFVRNVTFKLVKVLPNAVGYEPFDKVGQAVTIHFDSRRGAFKELSLAEGTVMDVWFGEPDAREGKGAVADQPVWGSSVRGVFLKRDGLLFD